MLSWSSFYDLMILDIGQILTYISLKEDEVHRTVTDKPPYRLLRRNIITRRTACKDNNQYYQVDRLIETIDRLGPAIITAYTDDVNFG